LDNFFLSLDKIDETTNTNLLHLLDVIWLISKTREIHKHKHPSAKAIIAEFKGDSTKNLEFDSLNSLVKHLKGDRQVIREYLTSAKSGYYRGKWKFFYKTEKKHSSL
jgi:hypothetical protein